jgi:hypothetical protein
MVETGIALAVGIAALAIAFGLVWFGRLYSHTPFMNNGVVFVTYPSILLVFIAFGVALMVTAFR